VDSEAASKKLGRPEVFTAEALEQARRSGVAAARHVKTRRGAQDLVYRIRAVAVIERYREIYPEEATPLEWLFKPGDMRGETWRHSLLTELGRARRPQWIIAIALRITQLKPPAKQGVRLIRRWRQALEEGEARRESAQAGAGEADTP
jgi:hypothetical protein